MRSAFIIEVRDSCAVLLCEGSRNGKDTVTLQDRKKENVVKSTHKQTDETAELQNPLIN